jgi:signal transduction histidine kinase
MTQPFLAAAFRSAILKLDPRRSLSAAAMWLIIALAVTFSIAAAIWVGSIARRNVLEQHIRRLTLETDQLSTDLSQALAVRLDAVRSVRAMSRAAGSGLGDVRTTFEALAAGYPDLDWIAAADAQGVIVASNGVPRAGDDSSAVPWVASGLRGVWIGVTDPKTRPVLVSTGTLMSLGDVAIPLRDEANRKLGVIAAQLTWRRAAHHPERLTDEPDAGITTEVYVIDKTGLILLGPKNLLGKRWPGVAVCGGAADSLADATEQGADAPRFERLPDGRRVLISSSALSAADEVTSLGWRVQLSEPNERVFQRANALALRILWVSLCLGVITSALGTWGARQLTRRLQQLALSVAHVGHEGHRIDVPSGVDEVARLAQAFAKLLEELAQERNELEHRVAVRSREVERLADESRYAAIVRERLKIARDLHDTLAHSMMAILSEIRFLRKLQAREPKALTKELARAEAIAQEGLQEARSAITQMRVTAVRESGLGPVLAMMFERFINLTGIPGHFHADDTASRFGDERSEALVRIAQEALRNIERHAKATHVSLRLESIDQATLELRIEDNGIGFEPREVHPGHYGIIGLREQAELIGAQLEIQSRREGGTRLRVVLGVSPMVFEPRDGVSTR